MSSYRSIVVGIDGTQCSIRAVEAAARLARDAAATLTVTCAYQEVSARDRAFIADILKGDTYGASAAAAADHLLWAAAERARLQGLGRVDQRSRSGAPDDALLAIATESSADLIVIGDRAYDSPLSRRFRSFSSEVTRRSKSDVLIVNTADR